MSSQQKEPESLETLSISKKHFSMALVTCSVRPHRINPLITSHVQSILQSHLSTLTLTTPVTLHTIDLATPGLLPPLIPAEPESIPAGQPKVDPTPHYASPTTRAWSAEVSRHDAFIFVTPQYNWGYPATIKHALDLLYHEWTGKVGWVVSYGGRGGGRGKGQLEVVLLGLHMQVIGRDGKGGGEGGVEIKVPIEVGERCIRAGKLEGGLVEGWEGEGVGGRLRKGLEEVVGMFTQLEGEKRDGEGH